MNPRLPFLLVPFLLAACGGTPPKPVVDPAPPPPSAPSAPSAAVPPAPTLARPGPGGGYYLDDGPLDAAHIDLAAVPDAVPRDEPLHRFANRPYTVLGQSFTPQTTLAPFRQQGVASWYGRRYHGQKTSSGEPYDMFAMTAAHPTLPIPSYARVTRPDTGKSVVVRINDRGPFLHGRVIDLSYVAAWKLGIVDKGSGNVVVETLLAGATGDADDHYLQLGAFASHDNAEALRVRLARTLGELGERLRIRQVDNLHRVQIGPWRDADEARRMAEQLRLAFDLPSLLVK